MNKMGFGLGIGLCLVVALIALFAAIHFYIRWKREARKRQQEEKRRTEIPPPQLRQGASRVEVQNTQLNLYLDPDFDSTKYLIPRHEIQGETDILVGMGSFSSVHRSLVRGKPAAVKVSRHDCDANYVKAMLREASIMSYLGEHRYLLEFIGVNIDEVGRGVVYSVTGFYKNGSLLAYLRSQTRDDGTETCSLSRPEMLRFCYEIASAMNHIAEMKVVHGDIAARNVFLDENFTCKLGDYIMSRRLNEGEQYYVMEEQLPLPWKHAALESLRNLMFSSKSDVWSYGITAWEIFSLGSDPYPGIGWSPSFVEELQNGMRMDKPTFATEEIYSVMRDCWKEDPNERSTFAYLAEFFLSLREGDYAVL